MKEIKINVTDLNLFYGPKQALKNVTVEIPVQKVTAFIGPSGCGKSTFLRVLNRMNDLIDSVRITGEVLIDGINIYERSIDVVNLRRKIGMVFQKSNLFPMSIYDNLVYGVRISGIKNKKTLMKLIKEIEQKNKNVTIIYNAEDEQHNNAVVLRDKLNNYKTINAQISRIHGA